MGVLLMITVVGAVLGTTGLVCGPETGPVPYAFGSLLVAAVLFFPSLYLAMD